MPMTFKFAVAPPATMLIGLVRSPRLGSPLTRTDKITRVRRC
jgi:hypothetical protein